MAIAAKALALANGVDERDDPMRHTPSGEHDHQHEHIAVERNGRVEIVRDILDLQLNGRFLVGLPKCSSERVMVRECGSGG